jgi:hypothetical protein
MATDYCYECDEPVSRSIAIMRSVNFEQVAFHRECWTVYAGEIAIPQPRASTEDVQHQSA